MKTCPGKTEWSISHFKYPCVVSQIDDLKGYDPRTHDALVFDDMTFNDWPTEDVIHLLDRTRSRSIKCRYFNVKIPADVPKIFVHNVGNIFYTDATNAEHVRAITRRHSVCEITASLIRNI